MRANFFATSYEVVAVPYEVILKFDLRNLGAPWVAYVHGHTKGGTEVSLGIAKPNASEALAHAQEVCDAWNEHGPRLGP